MGHKPQIETNSELLATIQKPSQLTVTVSNFIVLNLSTKTLSVIKLKLEISCSAAAALICKLPRVHGFYHVDFIILFIFKCKLVELIA